MKNLSKTDRAKQFLGELLEETLCWGCTDEQHELAKELTEILGEFTPKWISDDDYDFDEE